jgi:predicted Zn-dependent protease
VSVPGKEFMRRFVRETIATVMALLLLAACAAAQQDTVARAMRDELARTVSQLQLSGMEKPYFVAYRVDEIQQVKVSASLGDLTVSHPTRVRLLKVELRVGDYALDNSNYLAPRTFTGGMSRMFSGIGEAPLDDNYGEIRRQLWLATDAEYKKALEDLSGKRAALQNRTRTEEIPDFSKEEPLKLEQPRSPMALDVPALERLARELSAEFKEAPEVFISSVGIEARDSYSRYLNSEGTSFTRSEPVVELVIRAEAQAASGLPLEETIHLWGKSLSDLPSREQLAAEVRAVGARLKRLRDAASMETYNGPVLFEQRAAAEIFAQVFAPGLIGTRTPMSDDPRFEMFFGQFMGQLGGGSFQDKIGGRVLPDFMSVVDNPKLGDYAGSRLLGSYAVDDDGVPARETRLVQRGVLKTLLTTRTPVKNIGHSSGSRRGWGPAPSNLIVSSEKVSSDQELRNDLLRRARERGLEYGIVVRRMGGGGLESLLRMAAMVTRQAAPTTALLEVYKVFPDGREELLQGVQVSDLTAVMFKDILAVGDKPVVYTDQFVPKMGALFSMGFGAAGPELPAVSYVVPALLFDDVTLTKVTGPFPAPPLSKSPLLEASK